MDRSQRLEATVMWLLRRKHGIRSRMWSDFQSLHRAMLLRSLQRAELHPSVGPTLSEQAE